MAESAAGDTKKIMPLRPANCGLIEHKVRRFNANVPGQMTVDDLENPDLWANLAPQFEMGSEVRCLADDMSFVAYGVVTYAQGSVAKLKIIARHKLDKVDHEALKDAAGDYNIVQKGPKKWCIVQMSTGDVIKEGIPNQMDAMRELADYQKALRA